MAVIRLARSPWAALLRWWDRRRVLAQLRTAEIELEWIRRLRERDMARERALKAYRDEQRVALAQLEK